MPRPDETRQGRYERLLGEHGPVRPGFDIRQAARAHTGLAGLLSGFAFASVVLLARTSLPSRCGAIQCDTLRERASLAFLVAVLCLVLAAFAFAAISAEEILARRCPNSAAFAAGGLICGIGCVFWGLAVLARLFLSGHAVVVADVAM